MRKIYKKASKAPYRRAEKIFHSLVTTVIEIVCVFLLLISAFFVYDSFMIEKSAQLDDYVKQYKPEIKVEEKKVVASLDELQAISRVHRYNQAFPEPAKTLRSVSGTSDGCPAGRGRS